MRAAFSLFLLLCAVRVTAQGVTLDPHAAIVRAPKAITQGHGLRPRALLPEDGNTVLHTVWRNGAVMDLLGTAWTKNGTPSQVSESPPLTPGFGPASAGGWYSLGTGADVLDFAGDWTIVLVATPKSAAGQNVLGDGAWQAYGFQLFIESGWSFYMNGNGTTNTRSVAHVLDAPNVVCFGRTGNLLGLAVNGGGWNPATFSSYAPATVQPLKLGWDGGGRVSFTGTVYEILATTTPASSALCASYAATVKSRLGITAW